MAKFDSILGTIGNTPTVRINNLTPRTDVNFYVKIERSTRWAPSRTAWRSA